MPSVLGVVFVFALFYSSRNSPIRKGDKVRTISPLTFAKAQPTTVT